MESLDVNARRQDKAKDVARMVLQMRQSGIKISDDEVLVQNAMLMPEIQEELKKIKILEMAGKMAVGESADRPPIDQPLNSLPNQSTSQPSNAEPESETVQQNLARNNLSLNEEAGLAVEPAKKIVRRRNPQIYGTVVERSVVDIRKTETHEQDFGFAENEPKPESILSAAEKTYEAVPFRPKKRPPTPVLLVLDDNATSFQPYRLRQNEFTIGRTQGDCLIAHDAQIAKHHAKIICKKLDDGFHWYLKDLDSQTGTWVLCRYFILGPGITFRIGDHKFSLSKQRLETLNINHSDPGEPVESQTMIWTLPENTGNPADRERNIRLHQEEYWFGQDPEACPIFHIDDPLVSARHAVMNIAPKGWKVKDLHSTNGIWLKVREIELKHATRFQLGEQRFQFYLP